MVASARLAAGLSGLRNRNARVTNKTQLRVLRGSIDADPIILDDEGDEKNRILASQGVDEEDANEHHLQAALFASSQRALSTSHVKSYNSNNDSAYIPTPDAAGVVSRYDTLYPTGRYHDPATHLRFSDSIDDCYAGGLSGGFTYLLDERDADWLERNNVVARGEGTSVTGAVNGVQGSNWASGSSVLRGVSRMPHARSAKGKGKEPEHCSSNVIQSNIVINEDQFELIMGLFEKWTDESVSPYLHLTHASEHFPDFAEYERFFSSPLAPSTFANFTVPVNVPPPETMVQLAKAIYPWWKERRIEREGHHIVPQLNVLVLEAQEKEDKTGGSPYICFRKRDVKPIRKTRTNNVTHTEKLTRLRGELQMSLDLASMVLQRENLKKDSAVASESLWRCRETFAENMMQLNSSTPGSVPTGDESLLFDKEHKSRKRVETTASGRIILTNRRLSQVRAGLSDPLEPHSPLSLNGDTSLLFETRQKDPTERVAAIQREVDRELAKMRKDDAYWEDVIDLPYQSTPVSAAEKFGRLSRASAPTSSSSLSTSGIRAQGTSVHIPRTARSARLRIGRGGRLQFDRRCTTQVHRHLQREWTGHAAGQEETERWASRSWRPRYEVDGEIWLKRRERQLGEDFWAHPSIHDMRGDFDGIDKVSAQPGQDVNITNGQGWRLPSFSSRDADSMDIDVTMPYPTEKDRSLEVLRERAVHHGGKDGGALALFIDGGNIDESERRPQDDGDVVDMNDIATRNNEVAWRIADRWKYDSDGAHQVQDNDDRILLDDFQPKFMRTKITLLEAHDHEMIATDPQLLTPPPLKQNRYLDHQLRLQRPGLPYPSPSSSTQVTLKTPSSRQMPMTSRQVPSPSILQNGTGVYPPLSLSPVQHLAPAVNGHSNPPARASSSPKPLNGMNALGLTPNGTRNPSDSSLTTAHVNTPVRTNQSPVSALFPQTGMTPGLSLNSVNGTGDAALHTTFQPQVAPPYPSLKTAIGRMLTGQQDSQQGRGFQKPASNNVNGTTGGDIAPLTHALGVNNVHLKLPTQRTPQLRARINGENRGATPSGENSSVDHYAHTQQLALSRLPANGSRPT